jgi:hypothetical protein
MLQILIWAVCVLIIGIGYCGRYLESLYAAQIGAKKHTGAAFLALMMLMAVVIFVLSIVQGGAIGNLLK